MKKRVLSMAMATVMAASLTACGSSSTATTAAPTETNADTSAAASEAASEAAGSSDADVQKIIDRGVLKVGCKSCIFLCGSNAIFLLTETVWKNVVRIIYITGKDRTVYREAVDLLGCKSLC